MGDVVGCRRALASARRAGIPSVVQIERASPTVFGR
jgi:hypothetical protein